MREIMAIFETEEREDNVPVSLYHATFEHHLPRIMNHGLGGAKSQRNFDISRSGVIYLSDDPDIAIEYASIPDDGRSGGARNRCILSLTDRGSAEMKMMKPNMAATRMNIMV
jgi:hypothetical protein